MAQGVARSRSSSAGQGERWWLLGYRRQKPDELCLAVLSVALLGALCAFGYRGWFSRYTADDYCTAGMQRAAGFLGAQIYWYEFWSGRVTYYLVVGLVELAGPMAAQVLPAMAILAWLALGAWALLPVARYQGWPAPMLSVTAGSAAVILVCLTGAPRLDQSLYWMTGMLTYLLPVMLMTAYAGWLAWRTLPPDSRAPSGRAIVASAAFLLVVGGLSEVSLAVQLALVGLATGFVWLLLRSGPYRGLRVLLAGGLVGSVISAVIVVGAPGNYVHEATVTGSVHQLSELPLAFRASVDFVGLFARAVQFRARPAVLLLLALTIGWGFRVRVTAWTPRRAARGLWYTGIGASTLVCGWLVLIAASVPGYFAQQWDVPERAQFVAVWVVAIGVAILGYLVGAVLGDASQVLGQRHSQAAWTVVWCAALLVVAAAPVASAREVLAAVPADAAYAAEWDSLDATLRADASAGRPAVVDHGLPPHFGFANLDPDATMYPNPCVARYYGLPSVRVLS